MALFRRRLLVSVLFVFAAAGSLFGQPFSVGAARESSIDSLLRLMTLAEKVGQMTQLTFNAVARTDGGRIPEPHEFDDDKLDSAIIVRHVGSLLNVSSHAFSVEKWSRLIRRVQETAVQKTRLRIPILYGIDAIHGATYTLGATLFPQSINLAATWDVRWADSVGRITAEEMLSSGIRWNFHPVLDLGRHPAWPRFWETYGEDPVVASTMGARYISSLQGRGEIGSTRFVSATLKHYAGYGQPWTGWDRTPAYLDERMLRDWHLVPFEAAVRAGAAAVMVNSGEISGVPGHANAYLLTTILKKEWGFAGLVVSDWEDIKRLHTRDRVATSPKDAVRMAVMAGVDMSMVPHDFSFADLLEECVREGIVPESRVDEAVRRILRVKYATGQFDDPFPESASPRSVGGPESKALNREISRSSIILAKNEDSLLPLGRETRILVVGPTANLMSALNGGWSITWQGDDESMYPEEASTILEAVSETFGRHKVSYVPGSTFDTLLDAGEAIEAAAGADVILLCLGEKAYCETPGNIDDLTLDEAQVQLARAMISTGKPVVLVLAQGRPRIVSRFVDGVKAVLIAGLPGMEGGRGVADILVGDANPYARLPYTYPRGPNSYTPYDYKPLETVHVRSNPPQWPFGHGLSYTTFGYSGLEVSKASIRMSDTVTIAVKVRNEGRRRGKEAVLLYVNDEFGQVSRPVRQLKKFDTVELEPGGETVVRFALTARDLLFTGLENRRIVEPGRFTVTVDVLEGHFSVEPD